MGGFSTITLGQATTDLAARLYDSNQQFWSGAELQNYLIESLRTWNALTSYWRNNFSFPLQAGIQWYDITSELTTGNNTLRPFTVLDGDILRLIQYHLLEPPYFSYPLTWTGSNQFTLTDILGAITRRQNQILGATGCTMARGSVSAPTNLGINVVPLPDTLLDLRRVAWIPSNNSSYVTSILKQSDVWEKRAFNPNYLSAAVAAVPQIWIKNTDPQPGFNVDTVPPVAGNYECLSVFAGTTSNTTAPAILAIPDDWSWLIKWGALGDLLGRESNAKDPARAAYCMKRFAQGIELLKATPAVLGLQINDSYPLSVDAMENGDDFNPGWEAAANSTPSTCYAPSLNLLAFNAPDANNSYNARVFVVQNAPVPFVGNNNAFLQISRDDYDSLLDYAQHVAMFKTGGAEFTDSIPLFESFLKQAAQYNSKLKVMGQFNQDQENISKLDSERNPMMAKTSA